MTVLGLGGSSISAGGSNDTFGLGSALGVGLGGSASGSGGVSGAGGSKGSSTIVIFLRVLGALSLAPAGRPPFFFGSGSSIIGACSLLSSITGSTISTTASAILHCCNIFTTIDQQSTNNSKTACYKWRVSRTTFSLRSASLPNQGIALMSLASPRNCPMPFDGISTAHLTTRIYCTRRSGRLCWTLGMSTSLQNGLWT